jgi:nicotinamidase/pyrazinamidase
LADPQRVLQHGDALIVVDVQVDFCPGGALPIERGDEVVPVLNRWIAAAFRGGIPAYASRDWHPKGHLSFTESGGQWPPHCLQDSEGARFHPDLRIADSTVIVTKGVRFDRDQYSAFDETGLAKELRARSVKRVWVGGLAQDVCVRATVLDARREGFEVIVIADATRPVTRVGGDEANEEMRRGGGRALRRPSERGGSKAGPPGFTRSLGPRAALLRPDGGRRRRFGTSSPSYSCKEIGCERGERTVTIRDRNYHCVVSRRRSCVPVRESLLHSETTDITHLPTVNSTESSKPDVE